MEIGVEAALRRIRAFAAHRGWKKSKLAAEAGLNDTTLRDFDKEDWNPTLETIRALEAVVPADFEAPQANQDDADLRAPSDAAA